MGYLARRSVKGPERRLIKDFAKSILSENKKHVAVFWEPLMDTGYPDLVFVYYNPKIFEYWCEGRKTLNVTDIKVLHYLHCVKGATSGTIETVLGMSDKKLLSSIERLLDCKMIRRYAKQWTPYSIEKTLCNQKNCRT